MARTLSARLAHDAKRHGRAMAAEDWFQEASIAICEAADEFITLGRPEGEWLPYANTRIRHKLLDLIVRPDGLGMSSSTAWRCLGGKGSKAAMDAFNKQPEPVTAGNTAHLIEEPASETRLLAFELLNKAAISDADRDAVKLFYLDGLTHAQVGEAMGWTVHQTRKRISRAIQAMREVGNA